MPTDRDPDDLGPFASPPCFLHELDPSARGWPAGDASASGRAAHSSKGPASRLLPERPFPPYAYLPGRFPHPTRDPRGHSYSSPGSSPAAQPPSDPDAMLWGMDLFNHGFYWEAHEAWEGEWRAAPKGTPARDVLHGLILLAAAGVKLREGKAGAARRHGLRAADLFRGVGVSEPDSHVGLLGFSLAALAALAAKAEDAVLRAGDRSREDLAFDFDLGPPCREGQGVAPG